MWIFFLNEVGAMFDGGFEANQRLGLLQCLMVKVQTITNSNIIVKINLLMESDRKSVV